MKLLIIDDEAQILEALELILSAEGHTVETMNSAQLAWDILRDTTYENPDIIISDIVMPGMNGFELLEALRSHPNFTTFPIILMSASISPAVEEELTQNQQVYYLRKPFRVEMLLNVLNEAYNADKSR